MNRTDRETGENILERIKRNVEHYNQTHTDMPVSISMGLAVSENPEQPLEETFKASDRMMYKEKLNRKG